MRRRLLAVVVLAVLIAGLPCLAQAGASTRGYDHRWHCNPWYGSRTLYGPKFIRRKGFRHGHCHRWHASRRHDMLFWKSRYGHRDYYGWRWARQGIGRDWGFRYKRQW